MKSVGLLQSFMESVGLLQSFMKSAGLLKSGMNLTTFCGLGYHWVLSITSRLLIILWCG